MICDIVIVCGMEGIKMTEQDKALKIYLRLMVGFVSQSYITQLGIIKGMGIYKEEDKNIPMEPLLKIWWDRIVEQNKLDQLNTELDLILKETRRLLKKNICENECN